MKRLGAHTERLVGLFVALHPENGPAWDLRVLYSWLAQMERQFYELLLSSGDERRTDDDP